MKSMPVELILTFLLLGVGIIILILGFIAYWLTAPPRLSAIPSWVGLTLFIGMIFMVGALFGALAYW